ncbi:MAG: hypothetical protein ACI9SE_004375 [Neolewinella sp.]|jgi:hypothetical protein
MRLCEHSDFEQAILRAAEHFKPRGLRAAIIEKDYYVTEALRQVANAAGDHIIFKGGTSLSKGWGLIDRFSEDIDLFLDPKSFEPALGTKAIDRQLKSLRNAVAEWPSLAHRQNESKTFGGSGRNDYFEYPQLFAAEGDVRNRVLLESGIASGREPTEEREITSYLAEFLTETGTTMGATDERPFRMSLLHFRRTFVEKLFAIHGKVEKLKRDGTRIRSYARHYYDLHQLAGQPDVTVMLASPEYQRIREDYEAVSLAHFPRDYACPEGGDFSKSDAIFPPEDLRKQLGADYTEQCSQLCYTAPPSWEQVMERLQELSSLLGT